MNIIQEEMSVYQILNSYPFLLEIFKKYGLGKFEDSEVLEKLGPLLKLKTALSTLSINSEMFIELLNNRINEEQKNSNFTLSDNPEKQSELTMLALLPCGMKVPFNRAFDEFCKKYNEKNNTRLHYLIEGNMNHEISYYAYIDSVTSIDELPDVIISSDINSFYHENFKKDFFQKDSFISLSTGQVNEDFSAIEYIDPEKQFTMLSANLLVLVSVDELLDDLPEKISWKDILDEKYTNTVVMRGQKEFFCNGVILPFYKIYGMEGVKKLARSVVTGVHPSQMVKMIDSKNKDIAPLYIMPYFFAQKIKDRHRITIHVPEEGAIVSPVQMLVKKTRAHEISEITDFLYGNELGKIFADAFFPSTRAEVKNSIEGVSRLFWIGWDFLKNNDIGQIKKDMDVVFKKEFRETGGVV